MLIIDQTLNQQKIIVTVSENSSIPTSYTLNITSPFSNNSYSLALGTNTSPFQDRYDEFVFDTQVWDNGFYNYSIIETNGHTAEVGTLEVIDETTPTYVSIPAISGDENFIVYKNSSE